MQSIIRISAIVFKELKQLSRDRITFAMVVMIPLVQLLLFGYAINTDVRYLPAAYVDHSHTTSSRQLLDSIRATQVVNFVAHYQSMTEAEQAITEGKVSAVLYLPADLEQRLLQLSQGSSKYLPRPAGHWVVDGSDPMITNAVRALRQMPLTEISRSATKAPVSFELVSYFNPEQRTAVNIVPGLIAVILTMTMILFTSAAIVREREQGNMEFLITTPIKPLELMLGKIVPYILVGFIQMLIILALGHLLFDVPFAADLLSLFVITFLFICASLALGLLISTKAQTQLQAMQMTVFVLLPSILLSGFMFPFAAMPEPAQWLAEMLPATHYVRMIRAVVLREAHWFDLGFDSLCLLLFSLIALSIATARFKKRLD